MKHGQIVSPSTFIAKPSNTDKSFHPELLKTRNPYFNKCPKTIVLAFKKHQWLKTQFLEQQTQKHFKKRRLIESKIEYALLYVY